MEEDGGGGEGGGYSKKGVGRARNRKVESLWVVGGWVGGGMRGLPQQFDLD